ncbi:hypothetical protein [Pantoea sp. BAV 3049]|uniref:hypothetical protein n=1 Tax=Pantoea sp. BAV 3049 TaxID=2654188 RepID=UPI00131E0B37|nr:hypothetical protein [Pantoea sp. BAV 3049]
MTITSEQLENLRGLIKFASPMPWHWATSNSMARLSSASGKDGDVLSAFRASDGVPCVSVSSDNMNLIVSAVNALPGLLAHIDAQASRIAEQQAVIDQRNGECDRLITELSIATDRVGINFDRAVTAEKELAVLREQKPVAWRAHCHYMDGTDAGVQYYDDAGLLGLREPLYCQPVPPAPVAVPDEMSYSDAVNFVLINGMSCEDRPTLAMRVWNACRAGVLRLNSGRKPQRFVVPLKKLSVEEVMHRSGFDRQYAEGWCSANDWAINEVKLAGGEIAE